ncbi:adenosylmethionine--8-amino-7-oxononanoate transaminase [Planctomicrobium sp. SH668]|uniref:adenosylmethionine--8-amino-7-oxononanoate transaminase n=1 Tax=Planctomicrobium sp. SH668 TaxID=3448126 RepID=UPI003F5C120A
MHQDSPSATQLRQWDNDHVWHPFAAMQAYREENAPIITEAEGFELVDSDGNRYLDGVSSLWCNVHGHRVPELDEAIRQQLDRVSHSTLLGLSSPPSIELAAQLVSRVPAGLNHVFYSDSGSTAVEVALKMAFQYHRQKSSGREDRKLFATLSSAYHGDTIGSVSVGNIDLFHRVYGELLFQTVSVPAPVALRTPEGQSSEAYIEHCFQEVERIVALHASDLAAFIIEPLVQGAAGVLVHPPGYLKHVRDITRKYGVPLIADEVAVGFGRTGAMFACEHEGVEPDFLCLAKGLTGGYLPLAATMTTTEIFNAFLGAPSEGRTFYHGHTFTGNPLACAVGLASLELFDKNRTLENAQRNAMILTEKLSALADHPHVAEVRQKGIMVGIELVESKETLQPYPSARRTGHLVTLAARKRGVIFRPIGDVIVLMPAPAMPADAVKRLCDVTIDSINATTGR